MLQQWIEKLKSREKEFSSMSKEEKRKASMMVSARQFVAANCILMLGARFLIAKFYFNRKVNMIVKSGIFMGLYVMSDLLVLESSLIPEIPYLEDGRLLEGARNMKNNSISWCKNELLPIFKRKESEVQSMISSHDASEDKTRPK